MQSRKGVTFFNREKIRSELVPLNYVQARRLKGPIYCALVKELYEEGCRIGARHLETLAGKETFFYETKAIRDRVSDNIELLMALFENMRVAEKVRILEEAHSYRATVKCFYQIVQLLEPYKIKFEWLLEHIYDIIIPICERIEGFNDTIADETIARIYFKTAKFHSTRENALLLAIKFMEKAMKLSRNEAWLSEYVTERECGVYPTLHLVAGREVADLLLRYANNIAAEDSNAADEFAHKAVISLGEVGLEKNKVQYMRALLSRAKYLLQSENSDASYKILLKVRKEVANSANVIEPKLLSDLFLYEGMYLWNQNLKSDALSKMEQALKLAQESGCKMREAEALVAIGKAYAAETLEQDKAREAFTLAKQIFGELGDVLNRKKAHYMLAKLHADQIFPCFLGLLKDDEEKCCGFYNLRQWKNSCKIFWNTMGIAELKEDKIYCLLEEDIKDTIAWKEN
ncbi:uncharacterized protein LOC128858206 [Anastrepha ludens]|uniref:uncharacterized protein LOC128858206 n=1 Tax=Anastrepha ludens TaxID=28586 RepID=UPI0023B0BECA|nr:uncharacterized protein LOC128858206 [Anastrepha ludens]